MVDFTPGPWQIAKRASRRVTNHHGVVICNAVLRNQGGPKAKKCLKDEHEAEANAVLIAAAPDMREALQAFVDHYPSGINSYLDDAVIAARAALAKATGQ